MGVMNTMNWAASAELFSSVGAHKRRQAIAYRRFSTGAEAVRFAIEELPAAALIGVVLEAEENRFDHRDIQALYDSPDYPLPRP
jgi:hypothetical protein